MRFETLVPVMLVALTACTSVDEDVGRQEQEASPPEASPPLPVLETTMDPLVVAVGEPGRLTFSLAASGGAGGAAQALPEGTELRLETIPQELTLDALPAEQIDEGIEVVWSSSTRLELRLTEPGVISGAVPWRCTNPGTSTLYIEGRLPGFVNMSATPDRGVIRVEEVLCTEAAADELPYAFLIADGDLGPFACIPTDDAAPDAPACVDTGAPAEGLRSLAATATGVLAAGGFSGTPVLAHWTPSGWTELSYPGMPFVEQVSVAADTWYADTDDGVLASVDDGASWSEVTGLPAQWSGDLHVADGNGARVLVADGQSFTSADGLAFTPEGPIDDGYTSGLAFGAGVFVATETGDGPAIGGIYWSTDGRDWTRAGDAPYGIAFLEDVAYGDGTFLAAGYGTVMQSMDGNRWSEVTPSEATDLYLHDVAYDAVTDQWLITSEAEVLTSADGGDTWSLHALPEVLPFGPLVAAPLPRAAR